MTWVVGGFKPNYVFMIGDLGITVDGQPLSQFGVMKVHQIGIHLLAGFAGDVYVMLDMVSFMRRWVARQKAAGAFINAPLLVDAVQTYWRSVAHQYDSDVLTEAFVGGWPSYYHAQVTPDMFLLQLFHEDDVPTVEMIEINMGDVASIGGGADLEDLIEVLHHQMDDANISDVLNRYQALRAGRPELPETVLGLGPTLTDGWVMLAAHALEEHLAGTGPFTGVGPVLVSAIADTYGCRFNTLSPHRPRILASPDEIRAVLDDYESLEVRLRADPTGRLTERQEVAAYVGEAGNAREALELFVRLLHDQTRNLGVDHRDTLRTRANIAVATGLAGDPRGALDMFTALLPDLERTLGPDHRDTLRTRGQIAQWTGQTGDARRAIDLGSDLLPRQQWLLGVDHPDTIETRSNIAYWTAEAGDASRALELAKDLLLDQCRILGADDPETLRTRANMARWTGQIGDVRGALELGMQLLPEFVRVLGVDHPDTLAVRNNIVVATGFADPRGALELAKALLSDQSRILGNDDAKTLVTRGNIAHWTSLTGDRSAALELFESLLPDLVQVLGPEHPTTMAARSTISSLTTAETDRAP